MESTKYILKPNGDHVKVELHLADPRSESAKGFSSLLKEYIADCEGLLCSPSDRGTLSGNPDIVDIINTVELLLEEEKRLFKSLRSAFNKMLLKLSCTLEGAAGSESLPSDPLDVVSEVTAAIDLSPEDFDGEQREILEFFREVGYLYPVGYLLFYEDLDLHLKKETTLDDIQELVQTATQENTVAPEDLDLIRSELQEQVESIERTLTTLTTNPLIRDTAFLGRFFEKLTTARKELEA